MTSGVNIYVCMPLKMVTYTYYNGPVRTIVRGIDGRARKQQKTVTYTYYNGPTRTVVHGMKEHVQMQRKAAT